MHPLELGLRYTPFPRSRFGFQVSVWISVLCPAGLEMLGNPPFPGLTYVCNFGEDWWGGGWALLCIIEGSFLLGTGLPFNHGVPGPKTCSGTELGKGFFLLRGLSSAFVFWLRTWSGPLLGASWG